MALLLCVLLYVHQNADHRPDGGANAAEASWPSTLDSYRSDKPNATRTIDPTKVFNDNLNGGAGLESQRGNTSNQLLIFVNFFS